MAGGAVLGGVKLLALQQAAQQQIDLCGVLVAVYALGHLLGGPFQPLLRLGQVKKFLAHRLLGQRQQRIGVAAVGSLDQLGQAHALHSPGLSRGLGGSCSVGAVQRVQLLAGLLAACIGGALQIKAIVLLTGLGALAHAAELGHRVKLLGTIGVFNVQRVR